MALLLGAVHAAGAWTNGQLLIWMDADRASAMQMVANKFEQDYGIPVRITKLWHLPLQCTLKSDRFAARLNLALRECDHARANC
jgi:maltose-binding protein MalE